MDKKLPFHILWLEQLPLVINEYMISGQAPMDRGALINPWKSQRSYRFSAEERDYKK